MLSHFWRHYSVVILLSTPREILHDLSRAELLHWFQSLKTILPQCQLLTRRVCWPAMVASIKHCASCQVNKPNNHRPGRLLKPLQISACPSQSVSMDLITALPVTGHGHSAIIVFVDRLSKMAHFTSKKTELNAVDCAAHFMHHVVRLHGCIDDIASDRDPRFTSKFFAEFCRLSGTQ